MKAKRENKERENLKLTGVRLETSFLEAFKELSNDDPDRATVSLLVRRACREFLERHGKLKK